MTEDTTPKPASKPVDASPDRIAKVMARAGIASRREAERMIVEGRVSVNGKKIDSPALDVMPTDRIVVDGKMLDEPQETRLWLYYKPIGLVTSEADEKGRQTIFDALPRDLPRVMTVGRLDLTSEGLLLLTNDGDLKRRLELPATGWLRRYRVRVNGTPNDMTFAPLRRGVTIDDEEFAPMEIKLDSQQGANAWLTVGIREGKNREIRRAMSHVGLQVNRLIRVGYGPFKLSGMEKNEVVEVKRRVLRDQLGGLLTGEDSGPREREMRPRGAEGPRGLRSDRADGRDGSRTFASRSVDGPRRSFGSSEGKGGDNAVAGGSTRRGFGQSGTRAGDKPGGGFRNGFGGKEHGNRPDRPQKPRFGRSDDGEATRFKGKPAGAGRDGDRQARPGFGKPRADGGDNVPGDRPRAPRPAGDGQQSGFRRAGDKPGYRDRTEGKPAYKTRHEGARDDGGRNDGGRGFSRSADGKPGYKQRRNGAADTGSDTGRGFKPRGESNFKPRGKGDFKSQGDGNTNSDRPYFGKSGGKTKGPKPFGKPLTETNRDGARPSGKPEGRPGGKPGGRPWGKPRV